jgi:hypothetical protein
MKAARIEAEAFYDGTFSSHAGQRARKRSFRRVYLELLLFGADCEAPVGSGCIALSISRRRRGELVAEGYPPGIVDRAAAIAAVEGADGQIITVLRPLGRRGRRYRRPFRTRRPKRPNTTKRSRT